MLESSGTEDMDEAPLYSKDTGGLDSESNTRFDPVEYIIDEGILWLASGASLVLFVEGSKTDENELATARWLAPLLLVTIEIIFTLCWLW